MLERLITPRLSSVRSKTSEMPLVQILDSSCFDLLIFLDFCYVDRIIGDSNQLYFKDCSSSVIP